MIDIIYLIILQLFDYLSNIFQMNLFSDMYSISFSFAFIGCILVLNENDLENALFLGLLFAIYQSFLLNYHNFNLLYIYLICIIVNFNLKKILNDNFFSRFIILLVLIFIKECILYLMAVLFSSLQMSILTFITNRLFFSIIINALVIIIMLFIDSIRSNFKIENEYNKRLEEDLFGSSLKKKSKL